jgi:DNA-binding SARP family transcriptional activator
MSNKVTYRQQYTRCGKERCRKCKEGAGHGPYWYAYWSENGRTVSKYVGIQLPTDAESERQGVKVTEDRFGTPTTGNNLTIPLTYNRVATSNADMEADTVQALPLQLPTQVLHIYALGQFRVDQLSGNVWHPVISRTWHRRRARALLGCLLSSPGHRLGREQAMEALWPDLDLETAANRLNGAVHELRRILEPDIVRPAASRMLRLERDMLGLADRTAIWVDADAFESLLNDANAIGLTPNYEADPTRAEQIERLLEHASTLYGGDYLLEELYSEWSAPRREVLRRGWIGLLLKLAELREARGAYTSAMEPLNRLLASDPTDETAVQRLMLLLTQLDRRGEALNTYRRLASRLERNYESEPLPETRELYEKLRQGHINKLVRPQNSLTGSEPIPSTIAEQNNVHPGTTPTGQTTPPIQTTQQVVEQIQPKPAVLPEPLTQNIIPYPGTHQLGRHNQSPLIGRARELETMHNVLLAIEDTTSESARESSEIGSPGTGIRASNAKKAHVLLLMGEAGIGKTRLAEELSQEANIRGWAVAWSRAYEQEGAVPYRPWIELLRTLLQYIPSEMLVSGVGGRGVDDIAHSAHPVHYAPSTLERLSTLLPELRDLLPQNARTYAQLPPEQERLHLWEATQELLSLLSKTTPLLLVLDDLHWTDGSSRELLAYITRHIQDQRILLLGTCRDVELTPNHGLRTLIADLRREQAIVTIAVQPLTQSQIGSLVAHLPQNIVQSIQTQAAGNPFFAEELARVSEATLPSKQEDSDSSARSLFAKHAAPGHSSTSSIRHHHHERQKSSSNNGLPEGIAAVLERRLGRLSNECQLLLGKAAVLGGSFEFGQLLSMASEHTEDMLLDLLEEALRAGLLTEEGTGARITYHFWHPLIVSHLYERLSAARCAQLHRRAAKAVLETHTGHEGEVAAAITHHLGKGGGELAQVALYAALAANQAYTLAAYAEAEQYYIQAVKTLTNGLLPWRDKTDASGARKMEQSLAQIPDPLHVARLLERACECAIVQGNYEQARETYDCILHLRKQQPAFTTEIEGKQEAQLQGLIWREIGRTWASNGQFEQAYECYKRGEQVMRDAGVTTGAAWACIFLAYGSIRNLQGNYDEARRYILEALTILEQPLQVQLTESSTACLPLPTAIPQQILQKGEPALRRFQTRTEQAMLGNPLEVGLAYELLGIIDANVGQFTEALKHLHKALAIFEQHDLAIAMVKVYGNLGAVHAVKSENTVARTYMQRALALAERMGNLPMIAFVSGNLGEMATRSGNLLEAEEQFRRSLAMAEQVNDPEQMCWSNVALAIALQDQGNLAGAAEGIRRSLSIARAMKSTHNTGGALIALADLRVVQAIIACKLQEETGIAEQQENVKRCHRLLWRAKATIQRALVVEGLESELVIEGQLIRASINFLLGELDTARADVMQTMEQARKHELGRMLGRSQRLLGRILAAQGAYEQANMAFEQAMDIFKECELRLDYARALHGYGDTLLERSKPGECTYQKGLAYLREARTIFADCHAQIDLEWVDSVLNHSIPESVVQ